MRCDGEARPELCEMRVAASAEPRWWDARGPGWWENSGVTSTYLAPQGVLDPGPVTMCPIDVQRRARWGPLMEEPIAMVFAFVVCTFALYKLLHGTGRRHRNRPPLL